MRKLHYECDGIAATVAAETVEQVLAGSDRKRTCPFLMERAKPHQRQAFSGKPDVWFENILYGEVSDPVDGGFAYHTVLRRFQHSMIDCPEYLGRLRFWGLSGLM